MTIRPRKPRRNGTAAAAERPIKLTAAIPAAVHRRLRALAASEGRPVQAVVLESIELRIRGFYPSAPNWPSGGVPAIAGSLHISDPDPPAGEKSSAG